MANQTIGVWAARGVRVLEDLVTREGENLATAAEWCADAIAAEGMVHLFGTGHSRMPVEEMFPRYGSYPGFNPLVELSMTFHTQVVGSNGQRQAMFIERVEGLAEQILHNYEFKNTDVLIVFSHSGISAVPLEIAMGGRARGLRVVVVTGVQHSLACIPQHSTGSRLLDHADLVIDLGTPVGDAMVTVPGIEEPLGPGSTLASVAVVNEIKIQTASFLVERGIVLPVLTDSVLVGPERSTELFDASYREHAKRLVATLAGAHGSKPRSGCPEMLEHAAAVVEQDPVTGSTP